MGDTLHTYHRTSMEGRGIHAITTTDHEEAFTMLQAVELQKALRNVLAWETVIIEAVQEAHGQQATTRELCKALEEAGTVLSGKTPGRG